jgi:hypothetical protein
MAASLNSVMPWLSSCALVGHGYSLQKCGCNQTSQRSGLENNYLVCFASFCVVAKFCNTHHLFFGNGRF